MTTPIIQECLTDEQIREISLLAREIWLQHYSPLIGTPQVEYMLEKFQSPEAINQQRLQEGYRYFEAKTNGEPVGYCAVKNDAPGSVFLSKFYVSEKARGLGIGKQLLQHAISELKSPGTVTVWLTVNKNNETSIAIYKKLGFCIAGEIVTDIGNGYKMDDYRLEYRNRDGQLNL